MNSDLLGSIPPGTVVEVSIDGSRPFFATYVYHDDDIVTIHKPVKNFLNLFKNLPLDRHMTFTFDLSAVRIALERA